jgi:hypothetical protein
MEIYVEGWKKGSNVRNQPAQDLKRGFLVALTQVRAFYYIQMKAVYLSFDIGSYELTRSSHP